MTLTMQHRVKLNKFQQATGKNMRGAGIQVNPTSMMGDNPSLKTPVPRASGDAVPEQFNSNKTCGRRALHEPGLLTAIFLKPSRLPDLAPMVDILKLVLGLEIPILSLGRQLTADPRAHNLGDLSPPSIGPREPSLAAGTPDASCTMPSTPADQQLKAWSG
jgi:hypothetical protein